MTCAACSARVQRALQREPGVTDANVNLMTASATISYDPETVTPVRLVEAIRHTGYGAELPAPDASAEAMVDAQEAAHDREIRELRGKLAVSLTAAVLTMGISMSLGERVGHGTADPLMPLMAPLTRMMHRVAPWMQQVSADTWRWLLLALTTPIVTWAGRQYYTRAWAALRHRGADMNTLIAVGTGSSFLYSLVVTLWDDWFSAHGIPPYVYYEAVVWIITLILLGNLLEARAKHRTTSAIRRLIGLRPLTAHGRARQRRDRDRARGAAGGRRGHRASRREGAGRRHRARGHQSRGRVHADRRAGSDPKEPGRFRRRRHVQPQRRAPVPGSASRLGHGAFPHHPPGAAGAGIQGPDPAARRPDRRGVRPGRDRDRDRHIRSLAGGRPGAGLPPCDGLRGHRAHHRVPMRDGARGADRGHGLHRPGRRDGDPDQER